jgi:predicted PurR-regulated permease PerM
MWYKQEFFKIATAAILVLLIFYLSLQILPLIQTTMGIILTLVLPVIFAGIIYYIFRPLRDFLESKKVPRFLTIILIFLIIALALSFLFFFIWPFISQQITEFTNTPKEKIKAVENKTLNIMNLFNFNSLSQEQLREMLGYYIQQSITFITSNIFVAISSIAQIASYIVVTPFILFYLLKDDHLMSYEVIKMTSDKHKDIVKKILRDIDTTLSVYISGQIVVSIFVSILIFIGYWLAGVHYALLLAWFAFIFNLIPFCGPIISTIPALFIGLSQSSLMGFKVVCVVIIVHLLDINLISPKIVGNRLQIHPVTIILLLVASFSLFGLLGVFLITPVYAMLRTLTWDFYQLKKERDRE